MHLSLIFGSSRSRTITPMFFSEIFVTASDPRLLPMLNWLCHHSISYTIVQQKRNGVHNYIWIMNLLNIPHKYYIGKYFRWKFWKGERGLFVYGKCTLPWLLVCILYVQTATSLFVSGPLATEFSSWYVIYIMSVPLVRCIILEIRYETTTCYISNLNPDLNLWLVRGIKKCAREAMGTKQRHRDMPRQDEWINANVL